MKNSNKKKKKVRIKKKKKKKKIKTKKTLYQKDIVIPQILQKLGLIYYKKE